MNALTTTSLTRWFHKLASPPYFDAFAARWSPRLFIVALVFFAFGLWQGLFVVPADYQQGDAFRLFFVHVPMAMLSLLVFMAMAVYSAIALIWRIKLCETLAMACAPTGALFTAVTLVTGSIWGKPMWGTWWDWDPRLTTELILLFLYLGVIALYAGIEDRRNAARAAGLLAIVGVVMVPIIKYSVTWWNSLHQGQTISLFGQSKIDASMVAPFWLMYAGLSCWFVASLLQRARLDNLRREMDKDWARKLAHKQSAPMESRP